MSLEFRAVGDDEKWDSYVQTLDSYSFLNSSARFRYNEEIGVRVFRFAIFKNQAFLGIINCEVGNSKIFGNFLECKHSPTLMENRGEYWQEIHEFLKRMAKENSCFMIRFAPLYRKEFLEKANKEMTNENNQLITFYENNSFRKAPIHNVDALVSQHIDLSKDLEKLRRDMSKTKRNLLNRLLDNDDVRVEIFNDNSQFDVFKDLHEQTVKLKGYTDKPTSLLIKELEIQVQKGLCHILIGYYKKKPIGVWQCSVYGKNMHLYHAATDTKFRDKNINITYLLFWESVKLGKQLGCSTFDLFGGVVPKGYEGKGHPWSGIGAFKESLGGRKVTYLHSRDYPVRRLKYIAYYYYSWIRTSLKGYTINW